MGTWFGSDGWDDDQRIELAQWENDAMDADAAAAEWEAEAMADADWARREAEALAGDDDDWEAEDAWATHTADLAAAGRHVIAPEPF